MIESRPLLRKNLCKKSTEHHHPRFALYCAPPMPKNENVFAAVSRFSILMIAIESSLNWPKLRAI